MRLRFVRCAIDDDSSPFFSVRCFAPARALFGRPTSFGLLLKLSFARRIPENVLYVSQKKRSSGFQLSDSAKLKYVVGKSVSYKLAIVPAVEHANHIR